MTFRTNEMSPEGSVCTPIVKNTFITLKSAELATTRRMSVPPSLRLCIGGKDFTCSGDFSDMRVSGRPQADSEVSTDVCTECSYDDVESGYRTPLLSDDEDSPYGRALPMSPMMKAFGEASHANDVEPPPPPCFLSTRPAIAKKSPRPLVRLSSAAPAFKPLASKEQVVSHQYDHPFAKVIKAAVKTMRDSDLISSFEISDNLRDCAIIVQANGDPALTESVLELAHQALLDAATQSKCVFVMGFCAPKPFNMCPSGFEVSLGAMESATAACWHVFKKGFCRHGDDCRKQHPTCKIPVRVLVEAPQLNAPVPTICDFKLKVADFVTTVASALEDCPSCVRVETMRKESSKCWTIELTTKAEGRVNEEYLLSVIKSTLLSHSNSSQGVYMLGYAAKPFISRPNGCSVVLGSMAAETRACWDFYSKGLCRKGCACKWEHPDCSMPINIVIKPHSR
jgi:hypothetical protein